MKRIVAEPFHYAFDGKNPTLLKVDKAYDFRPDDIPGIEDKLVPVGGAKKEPASAKKAKKTFTGPAGAIDTGGAKGHEPADKLD